MFAIGYGYIQQNRLCSIHGCTSSIAEPKNSSCNLCYMHKCRTVGCNNHSINSIGCVGYSGNRPYCEACEARIQSRNNTGSVSQYQAAQKPVERCIQQTKQDAYHMVFGQYTSPQYTVTSNGIVACQQIVIQQPVMLVQRTVPAFYIIH